MLLVAYHVVGNTPDSGLNIESGVYRELNDLLSYVRMPLFTFLSGIVYAYHPFTAGTLQFIKSKARRLLLPMLCVGTLLVIIQSNVTGANTSNINWATIHIYPVAHFWFVEAIFLIYLLMVLFEKFKIFDNTRGFFIVFIFSTTLYLLDFHEPIFSISGAIYLFPFFLAGMFLQRYKLTESLTIQSGLITLTIVTTILTLVFFGFLPTYSNRSLMALIIGLLFCVALLSLNLRVKTFAIIGGFSYSIFIYHVFFTAGARIALMRLGVSEQSVLFTIGVCLGLIGPIILDKLLRGSDFTKMFFLGMNTSSPKARNNE